jgi:GNAT superfamily N-acetyltransferase
MKAHYSAPEGFVGRSLIYEIYYDGVFYGHITAGSATLNVGGPPPLECPTQEQLGHIINNTFFHIEPDEAGKYPIRNFTTFVLRAFMQRAARDWEKPKNQGGYGDQVWAFQTLVEPPRTGELYRRAGFTELKMTQGWTCKRGPGEGERWGGKRVWDRGPGSVRRPKLVFWKWVVDPSTIPPSEPEEVGGQGEGFNQFRTLPADPERGNPLAAFGAIHADKVGTYWTVPVEVPLSDLASVRAVLQSKGRVTSIAEARRRGIELPPIELGIFNDGSAWIVDGNHRLLEARKARLPSLSVVFTFVDQPAPGRVGAHSAPRLTPEAVTAALATTHGNQRQAAADLGVSESGLRGVIERYGIHSRDFGPKPVRTTAFRRARVEEALRQARGNQVQAAKILGTTPSNLSHIVHDIYQIDIDALFGEEIEAVGGSAGEKKFKQFTLYAHEASYKNEWAVEAYDEHNNVIGMAEFAGVYEYERTEDDPYQKTLVALKGWQVGVRPGFRRLGLASAMYQFAEEAFGLKIVPGGFQTPEGAAFLKARKRKQEVGGRAEAMASSQQKKFKHFTMAARAVPEKDIWEVDAYPRDPEAPMAGLARFVRANRGVKTPKTLRGIDVWVFPLYRRQGLASAMYQFAEETFGVKILPGTVQTDLGKVFTQGRKREQVGAGPDPERMTPALAAYYAEERGLPMLEGTPKEIEDALVTRENAARILDKIKQHKEWRGSTAPITALRTELAAYRINEAESKFQEIASAENWFYSYNVPGSADFGFLLWRILYYGNSTSSLPSEWLNLIFSEAERMGRSRPRTTARQELLKSLAEYRARYGEVGAVRSDFQIVTHEGEFSADIMVLLRDRGRLQVGVMQLSWGEGVAAVTNVLVRRDFARRGIATMMYEVAAELAAKRGLPLVSDITRYPGAEAFWQKQVAKGRAIKAPLLPGQHPNQHPALPASVYQLNYPPPDSLGALLPFDLAAANGQPTAEQMITLYQISPDLVAPYGALWQLMQLEDPGLFAKKLRNWPAIDDLLSEGIKLLPYDSQQRLALTYARWCLWVLQDVAPNEMALAEEALQLAEDVLNEVVGEGQVDYMLDRIEPIRESRRQGAMNPNYPIAQKGQYETSARRAQWNWSAAANVWDAIGTALHNEMGDWLFVPSRGAVSALRTRDMLRDPLTTIELAQIENKLPSLPDAQLAMLIEEIRRVQSEAPQVGALRRRGHHGR